MHKLWKRFALGLMLVALSCAMGCADKAEPKYAECVALEAKGDLKGAVVACEAAVSADPKSKAGKAAADRLATVQAAQAAERQRLLKANSTDSLTTLLSAYPQSAEAGEALARLAVTLSLCPNLGKWSLKKRYALECETALQKGCTDNNLGVLMNAVLRTMLDEKRPAEVNVQVVQVFAKVASNLAQDVRAERSALERAPVRAGEQDLRQTLLKDYDDILGIAGSWQTALTNFGGDAGFYTTLRDKTARLSGTYSDHENARKQACGKLPPFSRDDAISGDGGPAAATPSSPSSGAAATVTSSASPIKVETKNREADGGVMVSVPAGEFLRGSPDGEGDPDEQPQKKITLAAFWIDKTEVTAGQYRKCQDAKACTASGLERWCNLADPNKDDNPINCVRWDQADEYCKWAGARLPTEAEWEKAARGTDGKTFPWGNQPPSCTLAVWYDTDTGKRCGDFGTWTAGSKPAGTSPYGALDMAGNVWEWVADPYNQGYYAMGPDTDPKGPEKGAFRIMRGGGWGNDGPGKLRSAERFKFPAGTKTPSTGFRCAMSAGG